MQKNYFLEMIKSLREEEEVVLYDRILKTTQEEDQEVIAYLESAYQNETLNYPFLAPKFNADAAIWSAKTIYIAAQLVLYRQNPSKDLVALFPVDEIETSPETILSVDLCFRFMPSLLNQLKLIDSSDFLLEILENKLEKWHYSGINYSLKLEATDYKTILDNQCLEQLYLNRIIKYKNIKLAKIPLFYNKISSNMGIYSETYWEGFKLLNIDEQN
ncbi:hypothetical protein [Chondrinema litorale]|uniref:hypothetical protein n=1 Tax=Chondrinema litorale TaxID=2994555 RepID=UPI00254365CB|nr:hypothetical protein [Chondrinema litorale]UZR97434.1 hypothetical protein OQ292_26870 [Chondrinema litorale]